MRHACLEPEQPQLRHLGVSHIGGKSGGGASTAFLVTKVRCSISRRQNWYDAPLAQMMPTYVRTWCTCVRSPGTYPWVHLNLSPGKKLTPSQSSSSLSSPMLSLLIPTEERSSHEPPLAFPRFPLPQPSALKHPPRPLHASSARQRKKAGRLFETVVERTDECNKATELPNAGTPRMLAR